MDLTLSDLLGTDEPSQDRRVLRAGPLAATLEAGQLRDIRWHGVEVVRGIAYLLRDSAWGTLPVSISPPEIREGAGAFSVSYVGAAEGASGRLTYKARIDAQAAGTLSFQATATAVTDFVTNRTGFVLLHPDSLAGLALRVGHSDDSLEDTSFPRQISPDQPAFDILSLDYAPAPGVSLRVAFEGGVWEMEDQRNWSDASFKTYFRPLALGFPYVIPAGSTESQQVVLSLAGQPEAEGTDTNSKADASRDAMPRMYLRLAEGEPVPASLPLSGIAQGLILRLRPDEADPERVAAAVSLAEREGLSLAVEAVFDQRDPDAETAACLRAIQGQPVETMLVAAARDLRTRPSNDLPEGEAPLGETVDALRRGGFGGRIGTGVPSFFTEFNRNPPPPADFAFFGLCPIVHAADDRSVVETLSVLPAIMDSAAQLVPGLRFWLGPLAIPPVVNPYGPGLAETDGTARTCLAGSDPRHRALFGAAHLLAAITRVLPWSEALAPVHLNGPTGLAGPDGEPYPLAYVIAEIARATGAGLVETRAAPGTAMLAWDRDGRRTVLLANTLDRAVDLSWPSGLQEAWMLAPGSRGWEPLEISGPMLRIKPYRTLRLRESAVP